MDIVYDILIGLISGIVFYVLLHLAELTAHKFYSEVELGYDIIAIRIPFILFIITSLLLFVLLGSVATMLVFIATPLPFLILEDMQCKHSHGKNMPIS